MLTVLIVDDDPAKTAAIRRLLGSLEFDLSVVEARSRASAVKVLADRSIDLMVLDLNLPRRDGVDPEPGIGFSIIEMTQSGALPAPSHVVALSAFETVANDYRQRFARLGWDVLHFDASSTSWASVLTERMLHIASASSRSGFRVDLAVLCALEQPELSAVLDLPWGWERRRQRHDDTVYHHGAFIVSSVEHSVVACSADLMGMPTSAAMAMKVIEAHRPRLLFMPGIAAGVEGSPGDVLVASEAWDAGAGKLRGPDSFEPAPTQSHGDRALVGLARELARDASVRARLAPVGFRDSVSIHVGPVASGAAVVAYRDALDSLVGQNRKLVALEMEAFGLYRAVELARAPRPRVLCAKSLCDYADSSKSDEWQALAAYTSSRFLLEFVNLWFAARA